MSTEAAKQRPNFAALKRANAGAYGPHQTRKAAAKLAEDLSALDRTVLRYVNSVTASFSSNRGDARSAGGTETAAATDGRPRDCSCDPLRPKYSTHRGPDGWLVCGHCGGRIGSSVSQLKIGSSTAGAAPRCVAAGDPRQGYAFPLESERRSANFDQLKPDACGQPLVAVAADDAAVDRQRLEHLRSDVIARAADFSEHDRGELMAALLNAERGEDCWRYERTIVQTGPQRHDRRLVLTDTGGTVTIGLDEPLFESHDANGNLEQRMRY